MKTKFFRNSVILFVAFILAFGFSFSNGTEAAESIAARYFVCLKNHCFESALDLYTSKVFAPTTREQRSQRILDTFGRLGELISFKLVSSHVNPFYGIEGDQTAAILYFDVRYSSYWAWEELTVIEIDKGIWRIGRHRIWPDVPLDEHLVGLPGPVHWSNKIVA